MIMMTMMMNREWRKKSNKGKESEAHRDIILARHLRNDNDTFFQNRSDLILRKKAMFGKSVFGSDFKTVVEKGEWVRNECSRKCRINEHLSSVEQTFMQRHTCPSLTTMISLLIALPSLPHISAL